MYHQVTQSLRRIGIAAAAALFIAPAAFAQVDDELTAEFYEFVEQSFEQETQRSPISLMQQGRRERMDEWDDFSDASTHEQHAINVAELEEMRERFPLDELSPEAQISYRMFEFRNEQRIRGYEFYRHGYPVNSLFFFPQGVNSFLGRLHPVETLDEAEAYVTRLEELERVFAQIADTIDDRTEFGVRPPDFTYPQVIEGMNNLVALATAESVEQHPLYMAFAQKLDAADFGDEDNERLLAAARDAITGPMARGYQDIIVSAEAAAAVSNERNGVWAGPDGEAYYDNLVRLFTNLDVTAEEVHNIGLAELERIEAEMMDVMRETGFEGTMAEFREFLLTDPAFTYENTDEDRERFLADAQAATDRVLAAAPEYFNILPEAGLEIRRVEPFREASAPVAFYNSPTPDGSVPGVFWANLREMSAWQTHGIESLVYHEAVPGHHFQRALQTELEDVPTFQSQFFSFAYIEGWGVYAERLAAEMGMYSDLYSYYSGLDSERWRVVRLVVDTGIHRYQWTEQQAIDYMTEHTTLDSTTILSEVRRYFTMPGQALSYKMGMNFILDQRARAREALGDDFDIRAFHDVVIGNGAVPLEVLEALVTEYIEETLAG